MRFAKTPLLLTFKPISLIIKVVHTSISFSRDTCKYNAISSFIALHTVQLADKFLIFRNWEHFPTFQIIVNKRPGKPIPDLL